MSALAPTLVPSDQDARETFGRLVETFIRDLQSWREHDTKVRTQPPLRPQPKPEDHADAEAYWRDYARWCVEKREHYEPYPRPTVGAHPDIIAAVAPVFGADGKISYVADFEVVDDGPTS